ncbi:hybrid sensor histidine kinase/response regulator transcription factor [Streptomyces sp. HK10]|uniref:helix-turn-helix transcriptional regulator n=1 Tax=Streptomyces sp. HK10 TaxID=3373255 RepID=UPI00374913F6
MWFTLHLGLGAPVSGATLAIPPAAAVLTATPFSRALRENRRRWYWDTPDAALWTAPVAAPTLLGPAPADRLAAAEARAAALAARNRIARELHDSVGHALSAVALQAGAARTALGSDPEFVRRALTAIEETARHTTGGLDAVLGMLREDGGTPSRAPAGPTLAGLDGLLERTRASGTPVTLATGPGSWRETPGLLPEAVSREAYRILQEGLANALRHAGRAPVTVSLLFPAAVRSLAARYAPHHRGRSLRARLTGREAEVLRLMAHGLSNAEIAGRMAVGAATVKTHVAAVLAKLGARDRTQAVITAYESGFVVPGPD